MAYATTTLDQHRTPEWLAEQQAKEREESASFEKTRADTTAAQRQFEAAFREWRASRPEFRALCKGVKSELPDGELQVLAAAAGCSGNDLSGLLSARRQALGMRDLAAQFAAAQKEFERLEKEFLALEQKLDVAKTHGESERLEAELHSRGDALGAARRRMAETQLAREIIKGAKTAGLI